MDALVREGLGKSVGPSTRERALMSVVNDVLEYETTAAPEFIDITDDIVRVVEQSGVTFGQVTVYSQHTTAAIKINENEPLLLRDLARTIRQIAPQGAYYEHNDFTRRTVNMNEDECANGHSHCQHLFLSSSETLPLVNGSMALGTWQRIFLVELDHPRPRRVMVSIVGVGE